MTHKITYINKEATLGKPATLEATVLTTVKLTEDSSQWQEINDAFTAYLRKEKGADETLARLLMGEAREEAPASVNTPQASSTYGEKDEVTDLLSSFKDSFLEGVDWLKENITKLEEGTPSTHHRAPEVPPVFDPFDFWRKQGYHGHHETSKEEAKLTEDCSEAHQEEEAELPLLPTPEELRLLKEDLKTVADEAKAEVSYWAREVNEGLERATRRGKTLILRKLMESMVKDLQEEERGE